MDELLGSGRIEPAVEAIGFKRCLDVLIWILKMARAAFAVAGLTVGTVQAQVIWQFVDRDDVTHIGNAPALTQRGVIWLPG
ncbi:MAG: hypothetical protein ACTS6O_10640, partial [Giesbergeria sp.]